MAIHIPCHIHRFPWRPFELVSSFDFGLMVSLQIMEWPWLNIKQEGEVLGRWHKEEPETEAKKIHISIDWQLTNNYLTLGCEWNTN